jgi:3-oxoacyl-[acyl-carrier-protein] synthase II
MRAGRTGIRYMREWDQLDDLRTRLGGAVDDFDHTAIYARKKTRSMGRVAVLGVRATERALQQAGLLDDPVLKAGRAGVSFGSSFGSTAPVLDFAHFMATGKAAGLNATSYIRMMSHTAAVNIGIAFGLTGRIITTSSACTSGSQGIGYAFEAIRSGQADIMIAGGAEELCPTMAVVFDTLFATSTSNDGPQTASRPFDKDRNGLVIGEGSAVLVLENAEHARARGARSWPRSSASAPIPTGRTSPSRRPERRPWPCVSRSMTRPWQRATFSSSAAMAPPPRAAT